MANCSKHLHLRSYALWGSHRVTGMAHAAGDEDIDHAKPGAMVDGAQLASSRLKLSTMVSYNRICSRWKMTV